MANLEEIWKNDYIYNIYTTSTRGISDMGLNDKLDKEYVNSVNKTAEIRKLVTQINAISAELQEDGFSVEFHGVRTIRNRITEVTVERTQKL